MLKEAADIGAHGVVGVTTEMNHPTNDKSCEVHLYGTAVVVEGAAAPAQPWTTQLAGHKLAKLIEIGFVPSAVLGPEGLAFNPSGDLFVAETSETSDPSQTVWDMVLELVPGPSGTFTPLGTCLLYTSGHEHADGQLGQRHDRNLGLGHTFHLAKGSPGLPRNEERGVEQGPHMSSVVSGNIPRTSARSSRSAA